MPDVIEILGATGSAFYFQQVWQAQEAAYRLET